MLSLHHPEVCTKCWCLCCSLSLQSRVLATHGRCSNVTVFIYSTITLYIVWFEVLIAVLLRIQVLLWCDAVWPMKMPHNDLASRQEPVLQWHSTTSRRSNSFHMRLFYITQTICICNSSILALFMCLGFPFEQNNRWSKQLSMSIQQWHS